MYKYTFAYLTQHGCVSRSRASPHFYSRKTASSGNKTCEHDNDGVSCVVNLNAVLSSLNAVLSCVNTVLSSISHPQQVKASDKRIGALAAVDTVPDYLPLLFQLKK